MERKLPIGAEVRAGEGVHLRVWAPDSSAVAVEVIRHGQTERTISLTAEEGGYFSDLVQKMTAGMLYRFRLDSGSFPDPASRFQPQGPHGPSQVVDPGTFRWADENWKGLDPSEIVIYEMHVGTFSAEGTWRAAMAHLPDLKELGITMVEIMPIADFSGRFGWGYDGVNLFAPSRLYGQPDDLRAFINAAHELGIGVILDVVYNHLGPDGDYLPRYSRDYFSTTYSCEWGDALNFDGLNSTPVREFFISNARYWISEFHFDGLRLDATQQIFDRSSPHILSEITRAARQAASGRRIFIVGENEPQDTILAREYGFDALWNDDYHHSAMVAATGRREAYYTDYVGSPQEFISGVKYGFLYQGQYYSWQKHRRGTPARELSSKNFVRFLQNHDQVANSLCGSRLHRLTSLPRLKALVALTLLGPGVPMLFQGEEFAGSSPFFYFADHDSELNQLVSKGRAEFLQQFRSISADGALALLREPSHPETFNLCKLDHSERQKHPEIYRLYQDLLRIRRDDPVIHDPCFLDGAVLADSAFVLRYFSSGDNDRLLIINLGTDLILNPCPEPLLAPHHRKGWRILWSSEHPTYGGCGTPAVETTAGWAIPGQAALLLSPDENPELASIKLSQKD